MGEKLTLVPISRDTSPPGYQHRAEAVEGEAARRLLEQHGYIPRRNKSRQYTFLCPFHEEPGELPTKKSPNFYLDPITSRYFCHSATCGERGNLVTLERHFGVDSDAVPEFRTRETQLREFESALTHDRRGPLYRQGLSDVTLERFRVGYDPMRDCFVIPYLEGRRPYAFRFYDPQRRGPGGSKYWWETGAEARLFNPGDAVGDEKGRVVIAEGELKCMLVVQLGYAAVAVPGAGIFKDEWHRLFNDARQIVICFDNDNPSYHTYGIDCAHCDGDCQGHNPGQDGAQRLLDAFSWRAKNIVLPLPHDTARKTDINEYVVRDGHTVDELAELLFGDKKRPFRVQTLAEILENPPDETVFLVEQGILPQAGRLLIAGRPKVGKMSGLSTPILTPTGWTTMGALQPGDQVIGADGHPTTVTHIHPQGVQPLYKVHMSDGTWTDAGAEHLWNIQTHYDREAEKRDGRPRWRTMETREIADLLAQGKSRHTYLPLVEPVEYDPNGPLPIDAYALGLLLGDGCFAMNTPSFTKAEPELHEALAKAFPDLQQQEIDAERGSIYLSGGGRGNSLTKELRALGLWGCRSWEKHIPQQYLRAAVEDRLALIQGLCDTDGWVARNDLGNTSAYFSSSSKALADGFVELVRSLGGVTRCQVKLAPKFQNGVGRTAYSIRAVLPSHFEPFRLTRKRDEWRRGRTKKDTHPNRRIVKVEYWKDEEAKCITVANPDGLYVTNDFIVTHNSLLVQNLVLSLAAGIPFLGRFQVDHPTRVLLLDRELSARSLYERLTIFMEHRPGYRAAAPNLCIDHDHLIKFDQEGAYDTLIQLVTQNGIEVVVFDTAYKFFFRDMDSASSLAKAWDVLDRLIHETGCSVVLTHHHRKAQKGQTGGDDGRDPDNVAGSFLWTGWPNGTIQLTFLNRSVDDPFNAVCSFTAFRDAAPPEPLVLYRNRETIAYQAITDHISGIKADAGPERPVDVHLNTANLMDYLLECAPIPEEEFFMKACQYFDATYRAVKPYLLDALNTPHFSRSDTQPYVLRYVGDVEEESWEQGQLDEQGEKNDNSNVRWLRPRPGQRDGD